jgi:hypothetical protein
MAVPKLPLTSTGHLLRRKPMQGPAIVIQGVVALVALALAAPTVALRAVENY